jgi:3-dehydroquinate dehydratase
MVEITGEVNRIDDDINLQKLEIDRINKRQANREQDLIKQIKETEEKIISNKAVLAYHEVLFFHPRSIRRQPFDPLS